LKRKLEVQNLFPPQINLIALSGNSTFLESVPLSAADGALAPLQYLLERIFLPRRVQRGIQVA
jgi:hypothetical protein